MPAQLDLTRLSVRQFAERFRSEMIPLSNTFSYFCATAPMSEDDLKEYLQEPVAALPPAMTAALPKISILLVPYLERYAKSSAPSASGSLTAVRINIATRARSHWTIPDGTGQGQVTMSIAW